MGASGPPPAMYSCLPSMCGAPWPVMVKHEICVCRGQLDAVVTVDGPPEVMVVAVTDQMICVSAIVVTWPFTSMVVVAVAVTGLAEEVAVAVDV